MVAPVNTDAFQVIDVVDVQVQIAAGLLNDYAARRVIHSVALMDYGVWTNQAKSDPS